MLTRKVPEGLLAAQAVAGRLAVRAGVRRLPNRDLDLFVVHDFLDPATCAGLIDLIDQERRPSTIADDVGIELYRTSETCDLSGEDSLVAEVDATICDLMGIPPAFGEPIQGQRYAPGQEFRPHTDTFNPGNVDFYVHCADRGQRTWTAMVYLNEVEAGGGTRFRKIGKTFHPERGTLLAWNNLLPDGRPNDATLHQGMKVRAGTKYILTKWFRERCPEVER